MASIARVRLIPLQSGSAGNSVLVEGGGARVLIDAGISAARAAERLRAIGVEPSTIDAVVISHDHSDHVGCAGILARRWGVPVHLTEPTWAAARHTFGEKTPWSRFRAGETLRFGGLSLETVPTPHDAADGVVFVATDGQVRLGILTDFGCCMWLPGVIETLDAVYIESNYDEIMLRDGPYPASLKRRIAGPGGHISNEESAALVAANGARLRWACLAHLSASNNRPDVALATHRARYGDALPLSVAPRDRTGEALTV